MSDHDRIDFGTEGLCHADDQIVRQGAQGTLGMCHPQIDVRRFEEADNDRELSISIDFF
jgi:hypothetical protein